MRALLDVNVLLALLDTDHVEHRTAKAWLAREITDGWASCPITENGFVRIISQPRYPSPVPPAEAIALLQIATKTAHHQFWSCDVSLLGERHVLAEHLLGTKQVTDLYLLALAVHNGGRFVTFDRSIPLEAVPGASAEHLVLL